MSGRREKSECKSDQEQMSNGDENVHDSDEANVYIQDLHALFLSCDSAHSGRLGRSQLARLCHQLHLGEQATLVTGTLLPRLGMTLGWREFKEGFVALLPDLVEMANSSADQHSTDIVQHDQIDVDQPKVDRSPSNRDLLDLQNEATSASSDVTVRNRADLHPSLQLALKSLALKDKRSLS